MLVSKSDTAYHGKVYQIYRDALGSAILYVSKTDSCSFRYSPWGTRLYYGNSMQTPPEVPTDYRRTLYWNPNLQLDAEGRARVTLYNNSRTTQIQVEAAG